MEIGQAARPAVAVEKAEIRRDPCVSGRGMDRAEDDPARCMSCAAGMEPPSFGEVEQDIGCVRRSGRRKKRGRHGGTVS